MIFGQFPKWRLPVHVAAIDNSYIIRQLKDWCSKLNKNGHLVVPVLISKTAIQTSTFPRLITR